MTIEVRPAEKWEGSDCAVCVPKFATFAPYGTLRVPNLHMVSIGRETGGNITSTIRLCPNHMRELAAKLAAATAAIPMKGEHDDG